MSLNRKINEEQLELETFSTQDAHSAIYWQFVSRKGKGAWNSSRKEKFCEKNEVPFMNSTKYFLQFSIVKPLLAHVFSKKALSLPTNSKGCNVRYTSYAKVRVTNKDATIVNRVIHILYTAR